VKEAMETTSIEERMRELTNQVILPPAGRASVNRRSLTEYPSLDSGDRTTTARATTIVAGPLRSVPRYVSGTSPASGTT
jgi:hypothetical protein